MTEILDSAFQADPIAVLAASLALAVVILAGFVKRGGVNAGYIIEVFCTFATIGSVLKLGVWLAFVLQDKPATPPTGMDLVLLLGGGCAIFWVTTTNLINSLSGPQGELSWLGNLLRGLSMVHRFPVSWRQRLGFPTNELHGQLPPSEAEEPEA